MTATAICLTLLLRAQAQPLDQVVVTAAPSIDAQRLADALRVYLDEFGIRVGARAAPEGGDLQKHLDDARRLGEDVRAVAVVRAEHGARDAVQIELVDLATDKALILSVPRPARDEDLYRALALKIQAVLRTTLSEARADLDPRSSLGRLVARDSGGDGRSGGSQSGAMAALALDVGYGLVAFPAGGPLFGGLAVRAAWRVRPSIELGAGTAALSSTHASNGTVDVTAAAIPVHLSARRAFLFGPAQLLFGPCLDADYIKIEASSASTPVRPAHNLMFAAGAEGEARLEILGAAWLFARVAALGVLNGESYDLAGAPVFDTSRFQMSGTVGAGVGLL